MRINQNIAAFNSYRNLSSTSTVMGKSLEKLSSGFRINRAADDAAGLVISQGLRAQVSGLRQATRNAQDGISVVQTAEGALNEVHGMLNRMRDLAVQASNASNDLAARQAAQAEIGQLTDEIDRVGASTTFGQIGLLDGTAAATPGSPADPGTPSTATFTADTNQLNLTAFMDELWLEVSVDGAPGQFVNINGNYADQDAFRQAIADGLNGVAGVTASYDALADEVTATTAAGSTITITADDGSGAAGIDDSDFVIVAGDPADPGTPASDGLTFQVGANADETIGLSIEQVSSSTLGIATLDVTDFAGSQAAISAIDGAISSVSTTRGALGAVQNRFESTIGNLQVTTENLAASESRIRDTDMALEMVSFTRHQVLLQAGTAMLGQANQLPQSVLRLLG